MTDPRIEIVARALCKTHGVSGAIWELWKHNAETAISALDAYERETPNNKHEAKLPCPQ